MAKSEKMTQRELKQPDAFQRVGADAREWLVGRQTLVILAVGVVLAGGLVVALFSYFSHRSEAKAAKELGAALEILERPVVPTPAEGAPPPPPAGENPPFKSAQEQDQALVKALTDFRTTHKGTPSAMTAALPLGKAEYRLGNAEGALAAFAEYLKVAPANDPMRAAALEGQGYAYEAQQKYDQALTSFDEMSKVDAGGYLEGMGQYHRARILILQGKKDDAATVLVKIPVDHANSAAARLATERTSLLAAEGVKIPPPPEPASSTKDGGA
ncbi:tetratricopeptide repeat protein [Hyalangium sp.]|uniref:tetratricopeptide repeat protein n=1 Tax=Hyalangium sp. TaxID=2028555 RepID=UPI002D373383|nr:tetratricopeptide repeat protein [Hyalangium sp.]HYH94414.1 tetratricopeptide repeat protein [Hyalangium sp.]